MDERTRRCAAERIPKRDGRASQGFARCAHESMEQQGCRCKEQDGRTCIVRTRVNFGMMVKAVERLHAIAHLVVVQKKNSIFLPLHLLLPSGAVCGFRSSFGTTTTILEGGVRASHLRHVRFRRLVVRNDRLGVVISNHTTPLLLIYYGRTPRLVDVLLVERLEFRNVLPDVVAIRVSLLAECDRAVAAEVLVEEATAAEPQPVEVVDRVVCIEQLLLEDARPSLPADPQVATCQKAGYHVPPEVVDEAFLA
mmetsp:Transcript_6502/g.14766  ORF Transcript_6502/g.14766 Transcript_6502/m.14766 type:complete len:252 (-) Transcript_6502:43-798(-)